jgi:hypothetical protein
MTAIWIMTQVAKFFGLCTVAFFAVYLGLEILYRIVGSYERHNKRNRK